MKNYPLYPFLPTALNYSTCCFLDYSTLLFPDAVVFEDHRKASIIIDYP